VEERLLVSRGGCQRGTSDSSALNPSRAYHATNSSFDLIVRPHAASNVDVQRKPPARVDLRLKRHVRRNGRLFRGRKEARPNLQIQRRDRRLKGKLL
jgi:hypothetical protein